MMSKHKQIKHLWMECKSLFINQLCTVYTSDANQYLFNKCWNTVQAILSTTITTLYIFTTLSEFFLHRAQQVFRWFPVDYFPLNWTERSMSMCLFLCFMHTRSSIINLIGALDKRLPFGDRPTIRDVIRRISHVDVISTSCELTSRHPRIYNRNETYANIVGWRELKNPRLRNL